MMTAGQLSMSSAEGRHSRSESSLWEAGKETARLSIVLRLIAALGLEIDLREAGATAATDTAKPSVHRTDNVVFDEPLPDDSIDLDAIVGGKPMRPR